MDTKVTPEQAVEEVRKVLPGLDYALVGSTYILGYGKDIDVLVLIPAGTHWQVADRLAEKGFTPSLKGYVPTDSWRSYVKGDVNALVTDDAVFFQGFIRSADVCKLLQIADRPTRVAVHDIVRDGKTYEEVMG